MCACACRHGQADVHITLKSFFYGLLMCLSVIPQEIQPGDHHKALLGWKVSVCVCKCVYVSRMRLFLLRCLGYLINNRLHIKPFTSSYRAWHGIKHSGKPTGAQTWRTHSKNDNMAMFSPPSCFPSYICSAFLPNCQESYLLLLSEWSILPSICISHIHSVSKSLQARTEGSRSSISTSTFFFWFSF